MIEEDLLSPPRLLIAEDDVDLNEMLSEELSEGGYSIRRVHDGREALRELMSSEYDILITDLNMPNMEGIELLNRISEEDIKVQSIVITGYGTIESAIESMRLGIYDYLCKPFKVDDLKRVVDDCFEKLKLERETIRLKGMLSLFKVSEAVGSSLSLNEIFETIADAAQSEIGGDVITVMSKDSGAEGYKEIFLKSNQSMAVEGFLKSRLWDKVNDDEPIVLSGRGCSKYFPAQRDCLRPTSLISVPLLVKKRSIGRLNIFSYKSGFSFHRGQEMLLEILASRAASAIENARLYRELDRAIKDIIGGLVRAQEAKDVYTRGHSERVAQYAGMIAKGLGLPDDKVETIFQAGLLHDIGKIGIPLDFLDIDGPITEDEHEIFQLHIQIGVRILKPINHLRKLIEIIQSHHERYDGYGYPDRRMGDEIPLGARIIAIADSYDAMTTDRPYRPSLLKDVAIAELMREAGGQFDPRLVEVFLGELKKQGIPIDKKDGILMVVREVSPCGMGPLVMDKRH